MAAVSVRRTSTHVSAGTPKDGERLIPATLSVISLASADGTIHVRLYNVEPGDYPAGAEYDISITRKP